MTVMERFEAPTDRVDFATRTAAFGRPVERRRDTLSPVDALGTSPRTGATDGSAASETTWEGDAIVVPTSGYGGLLALGAVAGTTAAAVFGAVIGWTGPVITFAALVGLDIGVLVGAAVGGVVARRQARATSGPRPLGQRRRARVHGVAVDPSR